LVPGGGDAYVLKWIIHDWDDERAIAIFRKLPKSDAATREASAYRGCHSAGQRAFIS